MRKIFTILFVLMSLSVSAQKYYNAQWYSLLSNQEHTIALSTPGTKTEETELDVFPPAESTMSYQWKNRKFWFNGTYGSLDLVFYESTNGSDYGDGETVVTCTVTTDRTTFQDATYNVKNPSNMRKFKFSMHTTYGCTVANLRLPLAKHILLSGGDYGKSSVSKTFTQKTRIGESSNIRADFRSFLTNGDISISLTEGDAEVFRLGSENNTTGVLATSTAGKSYAVGANACASANGTAAACANGQLGKIDNYSFQIYFCPKAVGEVTGKITISDGTSTATISIKGTGIKAEKLEVDTVLSFCKDGSIEFHGKTYDAEGTDVIDAVGETRDTTYNVTVTVLQPTTGTDSKTITVGKQESWNGIDLSTYAVGTHSVVFYTTNVAGCDSTVTLTLTVNKIERLVVPVSGSFCKGSSFEYRGTEYSEGKTYEIEVLGETRDTLFVLTVTELQPTTGTDEKTITVGVQESWNGIDLSTYAVGTHSVVFNTTNVAGCDSTVTLTLTVDKIEKLTTPVDLTICKGGSEWFHGKEYTTAVTENVEAEGATRDTTYVVTVTVNPISATSEEKEITEGDDVEWNYIALKDSAAGTYTIVYETTNVAGCDSTVTLTLTVKAKENQGGTTGLENIQRSDVDVQKFFRNGVMYIRRGETLYGLDGKKIE